MYDFILSSSILAFFWPFCDFIFSHLIQSSLSYRKLKWLLHLPYMNNSQFPNNPSSSMFKSYFLKFKRSNSIFQLSRLPEILFVAQLLCRVSLLVCQDRERESAAISNPQDCQEGEKGEFPRAQKNWTNYVILGVCVISSRSRLLPYYDPIPE